MEKQVLVVEDIYAGQYVALPSFFENKVIAAGKDPLTVVENARKEGCESPVLLFVPESDISQVYSC